MRKVIGLIALSVAGLVLFAGCRTPMSRQAAKKQMELAQDVYLANNIHAQDDGRYYTASYVNWTECKRHRIVPVNTPVAIHNWRKGFVILGMTEKKRTVYVEFNPGAARMNKQEYIDKITTSEKINLDDLAEVDQEGIENGEARTGMTKDGVRMALGYPAPDQTPNLDDNFWTYSTNRWGIYEVVFGDDGKVKEIRQ